MKRMDAGEAAGAAGAGLEHATGLCNRLYNFFARSFASQGAKLVTLGSHGRGDADAGAEDLYPPAASGSTAGSVQIGRDVPIRDADAGRKSNINERSEKFIRSQKEARRSEKAGVRRLSDGH